MKFKKTKSSSFRGYTLIELMLVVSILGIMASIIMPHAQILLIKAMQSKAKSNLGVLRTVLTLYYTKNEGVYPMLPGPGSVYTNGTRHSFSTIFVPEFIQRIPTPTLRDGMNSFNDLARDWDSSVNFLMEQDPPQDVWIQEGAPSYENIRLRWAPYYYDNVQNVIYIPNGNYDHTGVQYFYNW